MAVKPAILCITEGTDQDKKIRVGIAAENIVAIFARLFAFELAEQIAALGEGRDEGDRRDTIMFFGREEHARITRMDGKGEHPPAE